MSTQFGEQQLQDLLTSTLDNENEFADLLAEFTLPTAFTPDPKSPENNYPSAPSPKATSNVNANNGSHPRDLLQGMQPHELQLFFEFIQQRRREQQFSLLLQSNPSLASLAQPMQSFQSLQALQAMQNSIQGLNSSTLPQQYGLGDPTVTFPYLHSQYMSATHPDLKMHQISQRLDFSSVPVDQRPRDQQYRSPALETGESYATTIEDPAWKDSDLTFSPLTGPILTPHTAYSNSASSLSHAAGGVMTPSDLMSSIGPPAMLSSTFTNISEANTPSWDPRPSHHQSLQNLVEQTQALGFDSMTQCSPRIFPTNDAGQHTSTGSTRRGAGVSSKKTRPSPLMKPTPDSALKKRKGIESSFKPTKSSNTSANSSPFLGAVNPSSFAITPIGPASSAGAESNGCSLPPSSRTSPHQLSDLSNGSGLGINTPSPVELGLNAMHDDNDRGGPMEPPPTPGSHLRRDSGSIQVSSSTMHPVTPASLMNLSISQQEDLSVLDTDDTSASIKGKSITKPRRTPPKKTTRSKPTQKLKPLMASGATPETMAMLSNKSNYQNIMDGRAELLGLDPSKLNYSSNAAPSPDVRKTSHKAAEQKRRDSLKRCFEELRRLLPPIAPVGSDEERRPGEGNVGGQRNGTFDPENPNKGISKAALLRRSNEYLGMLHDRIERRDLAVTVLREKLRRLQEHMGPGFTEEEEVPGLDLDDIDRDEQAQRSLAFYENFESDDEDSKLDSKAKPGRRVPVAHRKSVNQDPDLKARPSRSSSRRSTRTSAQVFDDDTAMDEDD